MTGIIGIDSRILIRDGTKRDGTKGHFESVVGIAVKVRDYVLFDQAYQTALKKAFDSVGLPQDYKFYCTHDLSSLPGKYKFLDIFIQSLSAHVEKVHVFYTLFSKKRLSEVKVYGRLSRNERLKLAAPTRTYEELISKHLLQCFPGVCAWRLMEHLLPSTSQFHLDSYEGHISEAQEELEGSEFKRVVYPNGDCSNPIISTADLLLDVLDKRLAASRALLIFDNIRPALPEFGDKVLVYPISNKHLPKITPLDKIAINNLKVLKHPVFWVFKGEEMISSEILKSSKAFRNLVDFAACKAGVVKLFDRNLDIEHFQEGDFGVYLNTRGKEIIDSYSKLGKRFIPYKLDNMVPLEKQKV